MTRQTVSLLTLSVFIGLSGCQSSSSSQAKPEAEQTYAHLKQSEMQQHFNQMDEDGNGSLHPDEVKKVLQQEFNHMDKTQDGVVSMQDSIALRSELGEMDMDDDQSDDVTFAEYEQDIMASFHAMDTSKDSEVSFEELKAYYASQGAILE